MKQNDSGAAPFSKFENEEIRFLRDLVSQLSSRTKTVRGSTQELVNDTDSNAGIEAQAWEARADVVMDEETGEVNEHAGN